MPSCRIPRNPGHGEMHRPTPNGEVKEQNHDWAMFLVRKKKLVGLLGRPNTPDPPHSVYTL